MEQKKVIIIGAGMAGLSAGVYLRMNGYDTTIFEMGANPGGLCTTWDRGKYKVDLCINWLVGSNPASSFYARWNELIRMDELQFVNHEEFFRMEDDKGNYISFFTDLDRLEKEFLAKAPEDEKEILKFIKTTKKFLSFEMIPENASEVAGLWEKIRTAGELLPYMGVFGAHIRQSCLEYSTKFKNQLLRKTMERLFIPEMSIVFAMIALTWFHKKNAGYPIGGSLNFAMKFHDRYKELGGHIEFNRKVEKILTDNNKAIGVKLSNGERHLADYVVSAADGHATIFDMLEGRYTDKKLEHFYEHAKPFPSLVFVALGVKKDFSGFPPMVNFPVADPLRIDPLASKSDIGVFIHHFDPTLAPQGSTLLTVALDTYNYAHWKKLYDENRDEYEAEKKRIADDLIEIIDKRFGNIRESIEMTDVSTPVTLHNYTGNWNGSFEGWLMTTETGFSTLPHALPGLKNFYMCGQWVAIGGGLPTVLNSARETAQIICHEDGVRFKVRSPEGESVEV